MTETDTIEVEDAARSEPRGTLSIRTLAMPADTNQYGDIFGGWLLGQTNVAGGIFASTIAKGRTFFGVGGGIVADSRADLEWAETQLKASRLLRAAGAYEGEPVGAR